MNVVCPVDMNVVVWSFLKGDHACGPARASLPLAYIHSPDFSVASENDARRQALLQGRGAMAEAVLERPFFEVMVEEADFANVHCAFRCPLLNLVRAYDTAFRSYSDIRDLEGRTFKTFAEVERLHQTFLGECRTPLPIPVAGWHGSTDRRFDFHRTLWVQCQGQWTLIDGNHRAVAMVWQHRYFGGLPGGLRVHAFAQR